MENASKALTFAGVVLISLIVLAAVIFAFQDIRGVKKQEAEIQQDEEIAKFNKSYESFEKELYGSEFFSLANKIDDYNKSDDVKYNNYGKIQLIVTLKSGTDVKYRESYYVNLQNDVKKLNEIYLNIKYLETLNDAYSVMASTNQRDSQYQKAEYQKNDILKKIKKSDSEIKSRIQSDYDTYSKYSSLKTKKFKPRSDGIKYYENGRIKEMQFEEE